MSKKTYELTEPMKAALAKSPIDYIREYWEAHSTPEERDAAIARKATAEGAYAFIESVAKKHKVKSSACFPDQLTYDLAVIFFNAGSDGDEFVTAEEIAAKEKDEAERAARREQAKIEAEAKEAERRATLSPEELAAEMLVEAERKAKAEAESAKRMELEKARIEKKKANERKKAIAEEMAKRQLSFDF